MRRDTNNFGKISQRFGPVFFFLCFYIAVSSVFPGSLQAQQNDIRIPTVRSGQFSVDMTGEVEWVKIENPGFRVMCRRVQSIPKKVVFEQEKTEYSDARVSQISELLTEFSVDVSIDAKFVDIGAMIKLKNSVLRKSERKISRGMKFKIIENLDIIPMKCYNQQVILEKEYIKWTIKSEKYRGWLRGTKYFPVVKFTEETGVHNIRIDSKYSEMECGCVIEDKWRRVRDQDGLPMEASVNEGSKRFIYPLYWNRKWEIVSVSKFLPLSVKRIMLRAGENNINNNHNIVENSGYEINKSSNQISKLP